MEIRTTLDWFQIFLMMKKGPCQDQLLRFDRFLAAINQFEMFSFCSIKQNYRDKIENQPQKYKTQEVRVVPP